MSRISKRILGILVSMSVLVMVIMTVMVMQSMVSVSAYASGTGDSSDPYMIATPSQLAALATEVNDGETYAGKYFKLANNINLTDYLSETGGGYNEGKGWMPIGRQLDSAESSGALTNGAKPFSGNFDGNGRTISGLWINRTAANSADYPSFFIGLFGLTKNANVSNLNLVIDNSNYGTAGAKTGLGVQGGVHVGGMFGRANGATSVIENCHVSAKDNTKVAVYSNQQYSSYNSNTGGFAGVINAKTVTRCTANVNLYAEHKLVGGFVGFFGGNDPMAALTISKCYATGNIVRSYGNAAGFVGQVVGHSYGSANIEDCYATGNVSSTHPSPSAMAGFVGNFQTQYAVSSIKRSYYAGTLTNDPAKYWGFCATNSNEAFGAGDAMTENFFLQNATTNTALSGVTIAKVGNVFDITAVDTAAITVATFPASWTSTVWNITAAAWPTLVGVVPIVYNPDEDPTETEPPVTTTTALVSGTNLISGRWANEVLLANDGNLATAVVAGDGNTSPTFKKYVSDGSLGGGIHFSNVGLPQYNRIWGVDSVDGRYIVKYDLGASFALSGAKVYGLNDTATAPTWDVYLSDNEATLLNEGSKVVGDSVAIAGKSYGSQKPFSATVRYAAFVFTPTAAPFDVAVSEIELYGTGTPAAYAPGVPAAKQDTRPADQDSLLRTLGASSFEGLRATGYNLPTLAAGGQSFNAKYSDGGLTEPVDFGGYDSATPAFVYNLGDLYDLTHVGMYVSPSQKQQGFRIYASADRADLFNAQSLIYCYENKATPVSQVSVDVDVENVQYVAYVFTIFDTAYTMCRVHEVEAFGTLHGVTTTTQEPIAGDNLIASRQANATYFAPNGTLASAIMQGDGSRSPLFKKAITDGSFTGGARFNDGSKTQYNRLWDATSTSDRYIIKYDLGTSVDMTGAKVFGEYGTTIAPTWDIYVSDSESTLFNAGSKITADATTDTVRAFGSERRFTATGRYVAFVFAPTAAPFDVSISELQLFGTGTPTAYAPADVTPKQDALIADATTSLIHAYDTASIELLTNNVGYLPGMTAFTSAASAATMEKLNDGDRVNHGDIVNQYDNAMAPTFVYDLGSAYDLSHVAALFGASSGNPQQGIRIYAAADRADLFLSKSLVYTYESLTNATSQVSVDTAVSGVQYVAFMFSVYDTAYDTCRIKELEVYGTLSTGAPTGITVDVTGAPQSAVGFSVVGTRINVVVNAQPGLLLNQNLLYYTYDDNSDGQKWHPLYKRVGALSYDAVASNNETNNTVFFLDKPAQDITIRAPFVALSNTIDDVKANADKYLGVFGVSRHQEKSGIQFGSRILRTIVAGGKTYHLSSMGTQLMRNENLQATLSATPKTSAQTWAEWLTQVNTPTELVANRTMASATLVDRCGAHVDITARLINCIGPLATVEYVAVPYANYEASDGSTLFLEASNPSPARSFS